MQEMVKSIYSQDPAQQLEAATYIRKQLSNDRNPPISAVIQSGIIPRLIEFLGCDDFVQLQFEAAWALTNVASGDTEHTRTVINAGAVPIFVRLLGSQNEDVREQAVWALGNISGDSPECRDLVLGQGALQPLLQLLGDQAKLTLLRNGAWALSNFCRGKPKPDFAVVRQALPTLARLVHSKDEEVVTDSCWALSYLSDGTNDNIQEVIQSGICRKLVELLMHFQTSVLVPALRTVGNIVTGDDLQTQVIINCGALSCFLHLLNTAYKKSIKKEACWAISNITAGTQNQIQAVIEAGLIPPLVQMLTFSELDIKKEAAWAISNATQGGAPEQLEFLAGVGCIKPMCDLLACHDQKVIQVALDAIRNFLELGRNKQMQEGADAKNVYIQAIEDADGITKLEDLQSHQSEAIYNKAVSILETFFDTEEEQMAAEVVHVPETDAQGAFQFAAPNVPFHGGNNNNGQPFNFGEN
eukprot:TRINITY_DN3275_c0_g1_i4.p1 TRINITY_DN3275_c0_g1~~TRINITY_DN3275_c0_g1_i4.p1  ORF type:complete len:549 (+),score=80.48 TRINITY_DN3275_c0_g1_i4:238-1647(+)